MNAHANEKRKDEPIDDDKWMTDKHVLSLLFIRKFFETCNGEHWIRSNSGFKQLRIVIVVVVVRPAPNRFWTQDVIPKNGK